MRILLLLIALPVWAQTHIQDTTYFSFGNPSARFNPRRDPGPLAANSHQSIANLKGSTYLRSATT